MEEDGEPVPTMLFVNEAFLHSQSLKSSETNDDLKPEQEQSDSCLQDSPCIKTEEYELVNKEKEGSLTNDSDSIKSESETQVKEDCLISSDDYRAKVEPCESDEDENMSLYDAHPTANSDASLVTSPDTVMSTIKEEILPDCNDVEDCSEISNASRTSPSCSKMTEKSIVKCRVCNETFTHRADLKTHLLIHAGQSETASCNKKVCLSLEAKMNILQDVDSTLIRQVDIAKKYGVSKSTISLLIKKRKNVEEAIESSSFQLSRKRMRTSKNEKMDEALFTWFKQARAMNTPVDGPIMMAAADQLASELNVNFTPSPGWLDRFKKRRGIDFKTVKVKAEPVDTEVTNNRLSDVLQKLLKDYSPEDIFSANETGIFFECLPDKTSTLKGEICRGGKKAKERLTALVAANVTGSEKLPLLVIGNVLKPRCFKNVKLLPLDYTANNKAWMTGNIFETWLRKMDRKFYAQGRQILLLVDNCPAHPKADNLKAINLVFSPMNTSIIQPSDQGIVFTLKKYYRKQVLQKYLLHINDSSSPQDFNISVLDALYMLRIAWNEVTSIIIANCFRHAGFTTTSTTNTTDTAESQGDGDLTVDNEIQNLFQSLQDIIPMDNTVKAFCEVDEDVLACEDASLKDIASEINGSAGTDSENGEEEKPEEAPVSSVAARDALQVLTKYCQQQEGGEDLVDIMCQLDTRLSKFLNN